MTKDIRHRTTGIAAIVGPLLLLTSTVAYIAGGNGMNDGEVGGAIQVWAMIALGVAGIGLARMLESHAPRAAAVLTCLVIAGIAGGIGYGIDSIQADVHSTESLQETESAAAPLALQVPGLLFPVSLLTLGVMLARSGAAPKPLGVMLAIGAVMFPMSRIPDVEALAVASDAFLALALVPLGLSILGYRWGSARLAGA